MKRLVLLIIGVLIITPIIAFAEENFDYNNINLSAVFVTNADVSGIEKIKVNYRTFYNGRDKEETIYLLKDNGYSTVINTGTINDAVFNYGYCITTEGAPDKYGFLPITAERKFDDEKKTINIVLSVDFNSMKYDGKKYRENSDVTAQEMINRKNGVKSDVSSSGDNNQSKDKETTTTTEVVISDDPIIIGEKTTTVIQDTNNKSKKKREEKETNYNKLIPIIIIAGGLLFVFIIFTSIKIARSNKRV